MSELTRSWRLVGLVALAACDRQVDRDYQGDPLLQIEGSVTVPLGLEGSDLVPALVFPTSSPDNEHMCGRPTDAMTVVEVGVRGRFPSQFTLDVFDPPPDEVLFQPFPGEPAFAVGFVAAVDARHPDTFLVYPSDQDTYEAWRDLDIAECGQYALGVPSDGSLYCHVLHACTLDAEQCLHRTLHCAIEDNIINFNEDCELASSSGEPALAVAGYSVNHSLLYLPEPAPAGSEIAKVWANGSAITPGYHLFHHLQIDPPAPADVTACADDASTLATERYNEQHGTDIEDGHVLLLANQESELPARRDYECLLQEAMSEVCDLQTQRTSEEVGDEPISIELGTLASLNFSR